MRISDWSSDVCSSDLIDADQRLVGGRRQTRNRPVVTLGPARYGDAAVAVAPEILQDVLRLRATQQLLKARGVLEPQLKGLRALVGVSEVRFAFYPIALPLNIQKLAQTSGAAARRRAHVRCHVRSVCSSLHRPAPVSSFFGQLQQAQALPPNAPLLDSSSRQGRSRSRERSASHNL